MDEYDDLDSLDYSSALNSNKTIDCFVDFHDDSDGVEQETTKSPSMEEEDDIIILNQSEVLYDDVKNLLKSLINSIVDQENHLSQMKIQPAKRSSSIFNQDELLLKKKVRLNQTETKTLIFNGIFVSEQIDKQKQEKPFNQFLYNLGFDLCLEQLTSENDFLSKHDQQILTQFNEIFHQHPTYSCRYCSFQTDTQHVLDYHYLTPHTTLNSKFRQRKYRCTYCSFQTFRPGQLRKHMEHQHQRKLIDEPLLRRYPCSFCSFETNDETNFVKHQKRCQIEQERVFKAKNLLAPMNDGYRRSKNSWTTSNNRRIRPKSKNPNKSIFTSATAGNGDVMSMQDDSIPTILIESDHDSLGASSDDEFIISSNDESQSMTETDRINSLSVSQLGSFKTKKIETNPCATLNSSYINNQRSDNLGTVRKSNNYSTLSNLLMFNGTLSAPYSSSLNSISTSSSLLHQMRTQTNGDQYQICNICECYVFKSDFVKHVNEKHSMKSNSNQSGLTTPLTILNNSTNSINTPVPCLSISSISSKLTPEPASSIFLFSISEINEQPVILSMIKCPWCETNFDHIDMVTSHLMKYHRMTLAAAKVVVAEQMKVQGPSSSRLSMLLMKEIQQIQQIFGEKTYWKNQEVKVYLHRMKNVICFLCKIPADDVENHFLSLHQLELSKLDLLNQCCLCGLFFENSTISLVEHQLRSHEGVYYSSVLKQFIRFEPTPTVNQRLTRTSVVESKQSNSSSSRSTSGQNCLTTHTEKKFTCRKCSNTARLFTFDELIDHLLLKHDLNVKLYRNCIFCQQTFPKGKEFNQHCLDHLKEENPSIPLKRYRQRR